MPWTLLSFKVTIGDMLRENTQHLRTTDLVFAPLSWSSLEGYVS